MAERERWGDGLPVVFVDRETGIETTEEALAAKLGPSVDELRRQLAHNSIETIPCGQLNGEMIASLAQSMARGLAEEEMPRGYKDEVVRYAKWVCEAKTTDTIWRRVEALSLVLEGFTPIAQRLRDGEKIEGWEWRQAGRNVTDGAEKAEAKGHPVQSSDAAGRDARG